MAGQMALVCKARGSRHIRKPVACADQGTRLLQPPHEQIAMRTCCKCGPEMPREGKAVEAGDGLQLAGSHSFRGVRFEIVARQSCALPRQIAERTLRGLRKPCKSACNARNEVVDEQLVELAIQLAKRCEQRACQDGIPDDRVVDERQSDPLSSQAFEQ